MRHKGDRNEYKDMQDAEVMSAYRRIFASFGGVVGVRRIYELVSFAPAPRFFVSALQATRVVKRMHGGGGHGRMRGLRLRMYREIYRRTLELRSARPHVTLPRAVSEVVSQPAPEMYISPRQVAAIIKEESRRCYETRRQRFSRSC